MKNVLQIHQEHGKKINEIFGKIGRFFSGSDRPQLVDDLRFYTSKENEKTYFDKDGKIKSDLPFDIQKHITYLQNIESYRKKISNCTDEDGNTIPVKKNVIFNKTHLKIDDNKIIEDYSELLIENLVRGVGNNTFRKIQVKDLKCYDSDEDLYGIAWLLDRDTIYFADKISGKLYANKYNQSVNFWGDWQRGKFYGKFMDDKTSTSINTNKKDLLSKYNILSNLILKTKNNYHSKFGDTNFEELTRVIQNSSNEKVKKFYPEFLKIKKYLSTISSKQGMGTGSGNVSYVKSDEMLKLKSKIDQNINPEQTLEELQEFINYIGKINAKIDTFYDSLKSIRTGNTSPKTPPNAPMKIV